MSIRKIGVLALSVLAIGVIAAPAAAQAAHFQGTVTAKNRDARTFTDRNIEAVAFKNANGRWIASKVERSGQSGGGGDASGGRIDGPHHGGNDDGPNHT